MRCEFALLWLCSPRNAREGQLREHMLPGTALARIDGLYLTIEVSDPGQNPLTIAPARAARR